MRTAQLRTGGGVGKLGVEYPVRAVSFLGCISTGWMHKHSILKKWHKITDNALDNIFMFIFECIIAWACQFRFVKKIIKKFSDHFFGFTFKRNNFVIFRRFDCHHQLLVQNYFFSPISCNDCFYAVFISFWVPNFINGWDNEVIFVSFKNKI